MKADSQAPTVPETVYGPESQLRHPVTLMRQMVRDVLSSRGLAWRLFVRNISAMYRRTLLGYVWVFLPPVFTTVVWIFINASRILPVAETAIPYPLFVFGGSILWQTFIEALNAPLKTLEQSREMLTKVNFPREALILAGTAEVVLNLLVRLVLLAALMGYFRYSLPPTVAIAPFGIVMLILLGTIIGVFLVPVAMLYQDVQRGIVLFTSLWFFLTPVVYPLPTTYPANLLAKYNPVTPLLVTTRRWLLTGDASPNAFFLFYCAAIAVSLITGWVLYRIAMPHLVERMGE